MEGHIPWKAGIYLTHQGTTGRMDPMKPQAEAPQTLLQAVAYFADARVAHDFVAALRWPNGATCPKCESREVYLLSTRLLWKCRGCKKQFSVKVGTIFEDSPLSLSKWLPAMWLIVNCKN